MFKKKADTKRGTYTRCPLMAVEKGTIRIVAGRVGRMIDLRGRKKLNCFLEGDV